MPKTCRKEVAEEKCFRILFYQKCLTWEVWIEVSRLISQHTTHYTTATSIRFTQQLLIPFSAKELEPTLFQNFTSSNPISSLFLVAKLCVLLWRQFSLITTILQASYFVVIFTHCVIERSLFTIPKSKVQKI